MEPIQPKGNQTGNWISLILLQPLRNILPSLTGCVLHALPAIAMRVAGKVRNLLVPPVLQDIFHRDGIFLPTSFLLKRLGFMFWEKASVVCASRSSQPVYLVNLFTDLPPLFESCRTVNCDGDV